MKKSISLPDELGMQVMDRVYVGLARDPQSGTSFSAIVKQALERFLKEGNNGEVSVCSK